MRIRNQRLLIAASTLALIGGFLLVGPQAAQAAASIKVTPNAGLSNGQVVNVAGTGFAASQPVIIRECKSANCKNVGASQTNASGAFSADVPVVTDLGNDNNCLPANNCYLEALDSSGVNKAQATITFGGSTSTTRPGSTTTTIPGSTTTTAPGTGPCDNPTIKGTSKDDTLTGTTGADIILGAGGNDTIKSLGGDDVVCGGVGNDNINGGAGIDKIYGNDGNDTIDGAAGRDRCSGGPGTDTAANCEVTALVP